MDEEEFAKKVRQGMKFNYICFAVVIILVITASIAIIVYMNRPLSPSVTIESAESALSGDSILVKIGEEYYELDGNDEFSGMFRLNEWTLCKQFSADNVLVTLHFAEQYELYIYSDGKASFYYGYAGNNSKPEAYYEIPNDIAESIIDYIAEKGTARTLGDGINTSTFMK